MTIDEAKGIIQEKLTCMELSDKACYSDKDGCNRECDGCDYMYGQGTWKEHKEALEMAIKALEEIQAYKNGDCMNECEHYDNCTNYIYSKGYNKAIDDFVKKLEEHQQENWIDNLEYGITWNDIEQVAEQLKAGGDVR